MTSPRESSSPTPPDRAAVEKFLGTRTPWRAIASENERHAAVAVICLGESSTNKPEAVVLTRRARHLSRHPGQWAFPGGRREAGESAEECARRECLEEIGLKLEPSSTLGRLDDFVSRSGFRISPVLFWFEEALDFSPDPNEVASVHVVSWSDFDDRSLPRWRSDLDGRRLMTLPVDGAWVHAPTAAILYQAYRAVRWLEWVDVRGSEQPAFAWR